jgi:Tfp pilus assembly protein PilO
MTGRDRIVAMVIAALAVLGAAWLLVVSPARKEASKLETRVNAARGEVASAESQLSNARGAQAQYASAYTGIVSLGKAVPAAQEVPSLIYELEQASNLKRVEFLSITSGAGGGSSAGGAASKAGGAGAAASASVVGGAASAGFSQMPFTFTFEGSFFDLYELFQKLNHFAVRSASGGVQVSGRLLTIQSVKLAPTSSGEKGGKTGLLTGTVTATAYTLPAGQGLTGGATASGPAGTSATRTASSTSGGGGSPTPTAIVRATP